jgi:hypothetical protein
MSRDTRARVTRHHFRPSLRDSVGQQGAYAHTRAETSPTKIGPVNPPGVPPGLVRFGFLGAGQ